MMVLPFLAVAYIAFFPVFLSTYTKTANNKALQYITVQILLEQIHTLKVLFQSFRNKFVRFFSVPSPEVQLTDSDF